MGEGKGGVGACCTIHQKKRILRTFPKDKGGFPGEEDWGESVLQLIRRGKCVLTAWVLTDGGPYFEEGSGKVKFLLL